MSRQLISRSEDLRRLRDDGYEVEVHRAHLLVRHVPYVNSSREVKYGILVSTLSLAGDVTTRPDTHVTTFVGEAPCDRHGNVLTKILNSSDRQKLAEGLSIDHTFSSKPAAGYSNYYDKMTTYITILSSQAQAIDPTVTAQTFGVIEDTDPDSVFKYVDTASSRAGIAAITEKLRIGKVAIVGLGGTGSYVFDFVAKTPVGEIHLFDGDVFLQHNAFRSPGAPSVAELRKRPNKAKYSQQRYARMRRKIFVHTEYLDASNVELLRDMDFVFLTLDDGPARKLLAETLETWGTSFVDVGMGIYKSTESLGGQIRVTFSTSEQRTHVWEKDRIPFGATDSGNEYEQNIQIAELNALNAALAVIRWKKEVGFYLDLEREHFSIYEVDGNSILNEDQAA
jgi:hypothetical protein